MTPRHPGIERAYHAETGEPRFDVTQFSAKPKARLAARSDYSMIVHEGLAGVDVGYAGGRLEGWDVLMLSRGAPGRIVVQCEDERVEKHICGKRVSFIPDGPMVESIFPAERSAFQMIFPRGYLNRRVEQLPHENMRPFFSVRHPNLARLIGMLERETANPGFGSSLVTDGILNAIAAILSNADASRIDDQAARISLTPAKLRRVVDFIESRLGDQIQLDDIAAQAELSPFHFSRVFKLTTGETPYHYLRARRIERARKMLLDDKVPLAQLSLECGFASQSHFTAAFTREIGMSPGRFRRQKQLTDAV